MSDSILWSQSGVNKHDGEPFVQLLKGELLEGADVICQFTPEQARSHARDVLEATEASEQDAFLITFFRDQVGLDLDRCFALIVDFRKWREARGKKGPPSDRRDFVVTDKHEKPPAP